MASFNHFGALFEEQDSRGAEWVDITRITLDLASPLAVHAAKFLRVRSCL